MAPGELAGIKVPQFPLQDLAIGIARESSCEHHSAYPLLLTDPCIYPLTEGVWGWGIATRDNNCERGLAPFAVWNAYHGAFATP